MLASEQALDGKMFTKTMEEFVNGQKLRKIAPSEQIPGPIN